MRRHDPVPPVQFARESIRRAVGKASPHTWDGVPQGIAALEAYLADVMDADKDFADCEEWFCWAAFERLMARQCCAVWLSRMAALLGNPHAQWLRQAATHYTKAYEHYEQYRRAVMAGEPSRLSLRQRARTPERIKAIAPVLRRGIDEETRGLEILKGVAKSL